MKAKESTISTVTNQIKQINKYHKYLKLSFALFAIIIQLAILVFIIITTVAKSKDAKAKHQDLWNVLISNKHGFADRGFTQQAIEGVCEAYKIQLTQCNRNHQLFQNGIISYGYPNTMSNISLIKEYIDNFIATKGINRFVLPGFTYSNFLQKAIIEKGDVYQKNAIKFIAIDTSLQDSKKWPVNLWHLKFEQLIASYYAGIYAGVYALLHPEKFKDGNKTKSGKQIHFAALGGLWIDPIIKYALGFKWGINQVNRMKKQIVPNNQEVELVFVQYQTIGGMDLNQYGQKAKFDALKMFRSGISVIFSIAGALTSAMHDAALEEDVREKQKLNWIIGVDLDQGQAILKESSKSAARNGKILVSAILKIRERLAILIEQEINQKNSKGRTVIANEPAFVTIPNRFKKDKTWRKIQQWRLDKKPQQQMIAKIKNYFKQMWQNGKINKIMAQKISTFLNTQKDNLRNFFI